MVSASLGGVNHITLKVRWGLDLLKRMLSFQVVYSPFISEFSSFLCIYVVMA